jgi:hypothetical protein
LSFSVAQTKEPKSLSDKKNKEYFLSQKNPKSERINHLKDHFDNRNLKGSSNSNIKFSFGNIQLKLKVSNTNDPLEREADKTAEQIIGVNDDYSGSIMINENKQGSLNRKCFICEKEGDRVNEENTQISMEGNTNIKQNEISNETNSQINNVISNGGQPLDIQTREFMEFKFGENFGNVKIHTNEKAAEAARAVGALAFTVGQNIVFDHKDYSTWTNEGRKLLAHELVHVVHQTQSSQRTMVQRQPAPQKTSTAKEQYDTLVASSRFDDAINLVINTFHFSRKNLKRIWYDSNFKATNAQTYSPSIPGDSTVRIGPKAFENGFESFVHIIRHELEHVQQRASGIESEELREFLGESVEILSKGLPEENIGGFIQDAQEAMDHWDKLSPTEKRDNSSKFIEVRNKVSERYKEGKCKPYCKAFKSVMERFNAVPTGP